MDDVKLVEIDHVKAQLIEVISRLDTYRCDECQKCDAFKHDLECEDRCFCEKTADFLIANGVTVQQWIPVTERLPETEGCYLIYTARGSVCTGHFYPARRFHDGYMRKPGWGGKFTVTHWMPLPEPPREGV